jgi:tRNA(fMet)-specific endonuclease VapC
MPCLLDTNVCIEILRGRNAILRQRLGSVGLDQVVLCSVVLAELHCGAMLAVHPEAEKARVVEAFLGWRSLPFDDLAAERYGELRARLQRSGRLIGANDLLIAAIALANDLTLVTHNRSEFERVEGLRVEDWQGDAIA